MKSNAASRERFRVADELAVWIHHHKKAKPASRTKAWNHIQKSLKIHENLTPEQRNNLVQYKPIAIDADQDWMLEPVAWLCQLDARYGSDASEGSALALFRGFLAAFGQDAAAADPASVLQYKSRVQLLMLLLKLPDFTKRDVQEILRAVYQEIVTKDPEAAVFFIEESKKVVKGFYKDVNLEEYQNKAGFPLQEVFPNLRDYYALVANERHCRIKWNGIDKLVRQFEGQRDTLKEQLSEQQQTIGEAQYQHKLQAVEAQHQGCLEVIDAFGYAFVRGHGQSHPLWAAGPNLQGFSQAATHRPPGSKLLFKRRLKTALSQQLLRWHALVPDKAQGKLRSRVNRAVEALSSQVLAEQQKRQKRKAQQKEKRVKRKRAEQQKEKRTVNHQNVLAFNQYWGGAKEGHSVKKVRCLSNDEIQKKVKNLLFFLGDSQSAFERKTTLALCARLWCDAGNDLDFLCEMVKQCGPAMLDVLLLQDGDHAAADVSNGANTSRLVQKCVRKLNKALRQLNRWFANHESWLGMHDHMQGQKSRILLGQIRSAVITKCTALSKDPASTGGKAVASSYADASTQTAPLSSTFAGGLGAGEPGAWGFSGDGHGKRKRGSASSDSSHAAAASQYRRARNDPPWVGSLGRGGEVAPGGHVDFRGDYSARYSRSVVLGGQPGPGYLMAPALFRSSYSGLPAGIATGGHVDPFGNYSARDPRSVVQGGGQPGHGCLMASALSQPLYSGLPAGIATGGNLGRGYPDGLSIFSSVPVAMHPPSSRSNGSSASNVVDHMGVIPPAAGLFGNPVNVNRFRHTASAAPATQGCWGLRPPGPKQ